MIRIENTVVSGFAAAVRGMRNAKNSWNKADSIGGFISEDYLVDPIDKVVRLILANMDFDSQMQQEEAYEILCNYYHNNCVLSRDTVSGIIDYFIMGGNDLDLASTLAKAGTDHGKLLRQIQISVDITAPLFW